MEGNRCQVSLTLVYMSSTLFLEAFGQLSRDTNLGGIDSDEEDLYSVFRARAELMGWSTTSNRRRPLLWGMNEAELTAGIDASRIGYVQVGLEADMEAEVVEPGRARPPVTGWAALPIRRRSSVEPAMVLPALVQCFDDALRRFGVVELSGLQVTAGYLDPSTRSCLGDLVSVLNWFNTTLTGQAGALIAFDNELLGGHTEAELVASLQRRNTGSFEFGPVVPVPEQHSIKAEVETPTHSISPARSGLGVSVTLPEWTASAAAWVLAIVIDAARAGALDVRDFAVRITRIR